LAQYAKILRIPDAWQGAVRASDILWLAVMSLMLSLALLTFSSYVAALPLIREEWGLSNTQAGAIFSAYLAGYAVSALFVIPLTDRIAPATVFTVSAVVTVSASIAFPLIANDMYTASLLRVFSGLGLVGIYMPGLRIISERFSSGGRGAAMGFYVTAFYGANAISLSLTGALMARFEWRDAFTVLALISALSIPLAYFATRNEKARRLSTSTGLLNLKVIRNRTAGAYMLGYSFHAMELYAVRVWLPGLLAAVLIANGEGTNEATVKAATVGGLALAAGSVGPIIGGAISDRLGRAQTAAAIFALSGLCSWIIGWAGGFPWPVVVGISVVYGWAISADSSIYSTAITESASVEDLGSTMALQAFLGFMSGVVGPVLVGGVLDIFPENLEWKMAFSAVGIMAVVSIPVLLKAGDPKRTPKT
jgi:MFS family permease